MKNFEKYLLTLAAVAVMAVPGSAQTGERRATLGGPDGNRDGAGKCTIEVVVDGSAEVEIRGDRATLRTLSGQPAQWRRFVCSGPMPSDPADFRFSGVDGRGRQELVQDPQGARGAAIVRIQDPDGGAEGYTFDLTWRAAGFSSAPVGPRMGNVPMGNPPMGNPPMGNVPMGNRDRIAAPYDPVRACQDAVRERASQQYGIRDIDFRSAGDRDNEGRRDALVGFFEAFRGDRRDSYRFSCRIDQANGLVRGAEIFPERAEAPGDRYSQGRAEGPADRYAGGYDPTAACQRAVERQIQQSGYRNVQFGPLTSDNRRNGWFGGTATARRGNNGRSYDFEVGCSINQDTGDVRSVQATRR